MFHLVSSHSVISSYIQRRTNNLNLTNCSPLLKSPIGRLGTRANLGLVLPFLIIMTSSFSLLMQLWSAGPAAVDRSVR